MGVLNVQPFMNMILYIELKSLPQIFLQMTQWVIDPPICWRLVGSRVTGAVTIPMNVILHLHSIQSSLNLLFGFISGSGCFSSTSYILCHLIKTLGG